MLLGQPKVIGTWTTPEELCLDEDIASLKAEIFDHLAYDLFTFSGRVSLRCVKVVDSVIPSFKDTFLADVQACLSAHCLRGLMLGKD
jgi:hypothetical protein